LGWVARYALFALAAPSSVTWMILFGILLHGICCDFFFVAGQIYVDKRAPASVRGQAQGFLVFVTYGVGMLVGAQVAGIIYNSMMPGEVAQQAAAWSAFWWIPAAFAAVVLVLFAVLFPS